MVRQLPSYTRSLRSIRRSHFAIWCADPPTSVSLKIILYRVAVAAPSPRGEKNLGVRKPKKPEAAQPAAPERLRLLEQHQGEIVQTIRELVEIESPSDNKNALDRIAALLAEKFQALGGKTQLHHSAEFGDSLQVDFDGATKTSSRKPVLLLGHYDTVYPLGTLQNMPCKIENGRLKGPGVLDMKSGIALILHAIAALRSSYGELPRPVTVFLVSDEEIGSHSSRKITETLAKESAGVLVLEPAAGLRGAVKTARKGVGEYQLRVKGVASHAGLDPGKGHSAIVELAKQIAVISKFNQLGQGISVNPGVITGGTRTNVVAAEASVGIDVRIKRARQASAIDRKMRSLRAFDKKCEIEMTGSINRLPMERTKGVAALYGKARQIADQVRWKLEEAAVGGGSDGNFTAGLGIPTLDGMGGVGDGAHAVHEFVVISELPRRAFLLAGMIESA
jgi:glutamate carboxypeptidase